MLENVKRIVIKVGASQIYNYQTKKINIDWLTKLIKEIDDIRNLGKEVVIVTSGAIAMALKVLNIDFYKAKLLEKQALACIGQVELMGMYKDMFAKHGVDIAQVLLTIEDVESRKRYLSTRNVIDYLISNKILPIINENDAIATAEIRFGDNDRLSARVAQIANAELLVLFSNCDGLYTSNPQIDRDAELVKEVYEISTDIEKMAGDAPDGSGGMSAKIVAAKIALSSGCKVVIVNSQKNYDLVDALSGKTRSTWFITNHSSNVKYLKESK